MTSFDATTGTLVITLADGTTTETGTVTADTRIECMSSQQMGDDFASDGPGDGGGGDQGDGDGGGGDQGGQSCSTADLTPGAMVIAAELTINSSGAAWERIELASTSTTTGSGDNDGDDTGDNDGDNGGGGDFGGGGD